MVVDDVSFTVEKGRIFGLLGPNGAGKTTLMQMIATLLEPTSGIVSICGLDTKASAQKKDRIPDDGDQARSAFDPEPALRFFQ